MSPSYGSTLAVFLAALLLAAGGSSHPPKLNQNIAYVFAGTARSFSCPKVHWSIKLNLIDALGGVPSVFMRISTEDNLNTRTGSGTLHKSSYRQGEINATIEIFRPKIVEFFSLSNQEEEMRHNFAGVAHDVYRQHDLRRYSMFYHRSMAYKLAMRYERDHRMTFDWAVLVRLDASWLEPVMPIHQFRNDRVYATKTGYA